ncbi:hypothetical protein LEN26_005354 [Aphanomyces euteiches]|nr:hypothetical protein AeMF1_010314 [Aphanomyces euteiches]KAH9118334.1 hypothetical protein LEN26_012175 [Aphanomyces euteiches]KAH9138308.1 hypothetical protein LEN26_005354 [Aphanomyces euteiches]KAH9190898.1 hypothetical protein AeNC1_007125 [Aphanomyces euteiches]
MECLPEEEAAAFPVSSKGSIARHLLDALVIDMGALQDTTFRGLDNDASVRPIVWRMLLGLLGTYPSDWPHDLELKRGSYENLKSHYGVDDLHQWRHALGKDDETLVHDIEKVWHELFGIELCQDVARTHVDLAFFAPHGLASEWMVRVLFVFAKCHPDIGYCQGMHEVLAPLVYVFGTDEVKEWSNHAEADSFAAFETLMQLLAPLHLMSKQDPTKTGAQMQIVRLHKLLRQHDAGLWLHLNSLAVLPEYYSFRWYITLLSHEFTMDETLRIWDTLLADSKRFAFLHYVCCALIISHRDALTNRRADFGVCLTILQSKPTVSVDDLLKSAEALREVDRRTDLATRSRQHQANPA